MVVQDEKVATIASVKVFQNGTFLRTGKIGAVCHCAVFICSVFAMIEGVFIRVRGPSVRYSNRINLTMHAAIVFAMVLSLPMQCAACQESANDVAARSPNIVLINIDDCDVDLVSD